MISNGDFLISTKIQDCQKLNTPKDKHDTVSQRSLKKCQHVSKTLSHHHHNPVTFLMKYDWATSGG
jgi:hypothetical protein